MVWLFWTSMKSGMGLHGSRQRILRHRRQLLFPKLKERFPQPLSDFSPRASNNPLAKEFAVKQIGILIILSCIFLNSGLVEALGITCCLDSLRQVGAL